MEQVNITATKRSMTGKIVAKLRNAGKMPAVLYGNKVETQNLEVDQKEFLKALKTAGETTIVNLMVDGKTQPVLIHDVQNHYLHGHPIHADFYAVDMTEKITVAVPLHFIGESAAVKSMGGTLAKNLSEVEVECLPADLPHQIDVDISKLATFDDVIRIEDLSVPAKVTILGNPQELVINVAAPRTEEEMKSLDEAVKEDVTAVEGVVKPEEAAADADPADGKPEAKKE